MFYKKWLNQFCAEKRARGNKILFTASIRPDEVEKDISTLSRLKEAGCYGVFAGVESVNQELLDRIEKKITVEQCKNMIKDCKEAGLPLTIFFLFGIGETDEDVDNYIKFVRETNPPWLAAGLVNVYQKKNVGLLQTITDIRAHLRKRGGEISVNF